MKHGRSQTKTYRAWAGAKSRCFSPSNPAHRHYGARGITMCTRWQESFDAFLEDMGECPYPSYSLDRINNDGNYEPGNCRWASSVVQSNNRRTKCGGSKRKWTSVGLDLSIHATLNAIADNQSISVPKLIESICVQYLSMAGKKTAA